MSETFILDEWLWSDLNGDNGEGKQRESFFFLKILLKKCDKIAITKSSKFEQKAQSFSKSAIDIIKRKIAKIYLNQIRYNFFKYQEVDIETEEEIISAKNINLDDVYLIKTYYKIKASIITTDNKLINTLKAQNIPCKHRDEFLQEYL